MFGISKIFGFLISPDCGIHYLALITEIRGKPVGFALLRLCAAIFAIGLFRPLMTYPALLIRASSLLCSHAVGLFQPNQ